MAEDRELTALATRVADALGDRGWRLATAESCTGGWIAKVLTDLPGSSTWFEGGCVSYSDTMKQRFLDVDPRVLAAHGAVSPEVATAMAEGILHRSGVDLSVAVTGIAGPTGGTEYKPVGSVWFAWAGADGHRATQLEEFTGDREAVRRQTVALALRGVLDLLESA